LSEYNKPEQVPVAIAAQGRSTREHHRPPSSGDIAMEHMIQLHIEKLPEGVYLATSDEVQGLVAQGRTIQETIEIARDVAKKLIEAQTDLGTTQ